MSKPLISYYSEVEKFYFSPYLTIDQGIHSGDYLNVYAFIGKSTESTSNTDIIASSIENKKLLKNIIALKKANLSDISPVIRKIEWNSNEFYYSYDEKIDFSLKDSEGNLLKPFYIKNKYDQVFKCLWNGTNVDNSYNIVSIANNSTHYTISHEGGTFDIDSLITINTILPDQYNGTFKVVGSKVGSANVICSNSEQFTLAADSSYISGGRIRNANLTSEEPILESGTYSKDLIVKTSDGYKWKYLYTIDKFAKVKFTDDNFMPVPVKNIERYPYENGIGWGSIDTINVLNGGSGYTNGTNTVNIIVNGDGQGVVAEAFVSNNKIQDITVINKGYDYTYADISLVPSSGYSGTGGEVRYSISPIGGHNFDLLQELYCSDIIVSIQFEKSEGGKIPTDFSFNQVGLIYNPYVNTNIEDHANASFIYCATDLLLTSVGAPFSENEIAYQGINLESSTFRGTVVSFNASTNILSLINTSGTLEPSFEIKGSQTNTTKVIQQVFPSNYIPNSGNIFYVENRNDVQRDELGREQIRMLINYK